MVKQTVVVLALVAGILIIAFAGLNGQFNIAGSQCEDIPLLDANNRPIASFNQYRTIIGADISDAQLEDSGLAIVDGVLVQTNSCPEVLE